MKNIGSSWGGHYGQSKYSIWLIMQLLETGMICTENTVTWLM